MNFIELEQIVKERKSTTEKVYDEGKSSEWNKKSGWNAMMLAKLSVWDEIISLLKVYHDNP